MSSGFFYVKNYCFLVPATPTDCCPNWRAVFGYGLWSSSQNLLNISQKTSGPYVAWQGFGSEYAKMPIVLALLKLPEKMSVTPLLYMLTSIYNWLSGSVLLDTHFSSLQHCSECNYPCYGKPKVSFYNVFIKFTLNCLSTYFKGCFPMSFKV